MKSEKEPVNEANLSATPLADEDLTAAAGGQGMFHSVCPFCHKELLSPQAYVDHRAKNPDHYK